MRDTKSNEIDKVKLEHLIDLIKKLKMQKLPLKYQLFIGLEDDIGTQTIDNIFAINNSLKEAIGNLKCEDGLVEVYPFTKVEISLSDKNKVKDDFTAKCTPGHCNPKLKT